jgi:3-dehydroquinate synthase
MPELRVELPDRSYDITVASGALQRVGEGLDRLRLGRRAVLITHPEIRALHGEAVLASVAATGRTVECVLVHGGEGSKSVAELARLWGEFARLRLDRQAVVLALGGGVIGDLAGFAAATYLRGIELVQLPTTLLAQVDASVGGKTAIDLPVGKNLVGAFYQPRWVVADVATLATLPVRELVAGLAEVIKYGVIADAGLFSFLEGARERVLAGDPDALAEIVLRSCAIKADVVRQDEREQGLRAILNYGHTVGHAVEAVGGYAGLLHGECVAIGMTAATSLAVRLGMLALEDAERQRRLLEAYGLPVRLPADQEPVAILETMRWDKKARDGEVRFVLPRRIGAVEFGCAVPAELLAAVLAELRAG